MRNKENTNYFINKVFKSLFVLQGHLKLELHGKC